MIIIIFSIAAVISVSLKAMAYSFLSPEQINPVPGTTVDIKITQHDF